MYVGKWQVGCENGVWIKIKSEWKSVSTFPARPNLHGAQVVDRTEFNLHKKAQNRFLDSRVQRASHRKAYIVQVDTLEAKSTRMWDH